MSYRCIGGCKQYLFRPRSSMHEKGTRLTPGLLGILFLGLLTMLLSACGGNVALQQQAQQQGGTLDHLQAQALSIGVPTTSLQSIITQHQQLDATNAPLALFNTQPLDQYYRNLSLRYEQLYVQTQGLITATTEQLRQQADRDLQTLQNTLTRNSANHLPLNTLSQLYQQDKTKFGQSRYPKDYASIDTQAKNAIATITMMPTVLSKLQTTKSFISIMNDARQNTATLQKQYDTNQLAITQATTPQTLQSLSQTIDTQNEQATANFTRLLPTLTQAKLNELAANIQQVKQAGIDTSTYQQRFIAAQAQSANVKTISDYKAFAQQIDTDESLMQTDLLKAQATTLIAQFDQEVTTWGNAHQYYDKYNGQSYSLDGGYMTKGIGEDLDRALNAATTVADYQQVINTTNNEFFHLHVMEQNFQSKVPYNQPHTADSQLINYYHLQNAQVIIVSFTEEALRFYDHGRLVRSFLVTAGRPELPPVPGLWTMLDRQTNITFHSPYPPGSQYWYPDTPINYAMMYHSGGYFLHDSWWRNDYGPGTQFYHIDSSGNVSANYGTHGCVNIPTPQAQWLYTNTNYNTSIIMY